MKQWNRQRNNSFTFDDKKYWCVTVYSNWPAKSHILTVVSSTLISVHSMPMVDLMSIADFFHTGLACKQAQENLVNIFAYQRVLQRADQGCFPNPAVPNHYHSHLLPLFSALHCGSHPVSYLAQWFEFRWYQAHECLPCKMNGIKKNKNKKMKNKIKKKTKAKK